MEQAILLAVHGSKHPGAMTAVAVFRDRIAARFPDWRVVLARTVGRRHGPARAFGGLGRVAETLAELVTTGARRVAVQSLHVVPGGEYHELLADVVRLRETAAGIAVTVGAPLLADAADVERVTDAVLADLDGKRATGEALVLMGHGAPPPGDGFYTALRECLSRLDPLSAFGVLPKRRGAPSRDIGRIRESLVAAGVRTAWLMPFFTVAGAHAANDLAGEGPDSWRGRLEAAGIACRPSLRGLIEREPLAVVWREHLEGAMARLA